MYFDLHFICSFSCFLFILTSLLSFPQGEIMRNVPPQYLQHVYPSQYYGIYGKYSLPPSLSASSVVVVVKMMQLYRSINVRKIDVV